MTSISLLLHHRLLGLAPAAILLLCMLLLVLTALLDWLSGPDFSFSLFYILPLALAVRYAGRACAMAVAILSVLPLVYEGAVNGHLLLHPIKYFWNIALHLGTLALIGSMMHQTQLSLLHETRLARVDFLTGVLNRRAFRQSLASAMGERRGGADLMALAYIDLDDFKDVNEQGGHQLGDDVLRAMAAALSGSVRDSDIVGRLGGDEFALVLRAVDAHQAAAVLHKVKARMAQGAGLAPGVTCSIGCVLFRAARHEMDAVIHLADELMFEVKRQGKNGLLLREIDAQATPGGAPAP